MAASIEPRSNTAVDRTARCPLGGWARQCLVVGGIVALFALVLSTGIGGPAVAKTVSNFGLCAAALSAAVACLRRAYTFTGRMRWGWAFVGLGVLSWGLGQ